MYDCHGRARRFSARPGSGGLGADAQVSGAIPTRTWCASVASRLLTVALLAGAAAPALADTSQSSNWAGYAVHRVGRQVHEGDRHLEASRTAACVGRAARPTRRCGSASAATTSSSQALEQIGTEVDCTAVGHVVSTAWYELVPARRTAIKMTVHPGDRVSRHRHRSSGSQVTLSLIATSRRHRSFTQGRCTPRPSTSPRRSGSSRRRRCASARTELPDAPARRTSAPPAFSSASAVATAGHRGTIADHRLGRRPRSASPPPGRQFVSDSGGVARPTAVPSTLSARRNARSRSPTRGSADAERHPCRRRRAWRATRRAPLTKFAERGRYISLPRAADPQQGAVIRSSPREPGSLMTITTRRHPPPVLDHQPRRGLRRARAGQPRRVARTADEHEVDARRGPDLPALHEVLSLATLVAIAGPRPVACSATSSCTRPRRHRDPVR